MLAEQVKSGALPAVDKRVPKQPMVVTNFAGARRPRPAGRPAQHAGGERARYAPDDGLQLHAPDRVLRPSSSCSPTSSRATRTRTTGSSPSSCARATSGPTASPSPPRISASSGKTSPTTRSSRPPARRSSSGRRPAAQGRDHRRAHHQVQLGQAQPLLHREPGARRAALPVPAGALPQEVPRQVRLARGHRQGGQGRPVRRQLGADLPAPRRHVRQRQPGPADAQPVGQHHGLAGAALRVRAQPLLSPHRRQGAAAALCRPRDLHPGGDQPGAGQGRAGRGRPAAALSQHARLHLPAEERQELGRRGAAVGIGLGLAARALSQPQRQRRGVAQADARRALPPRAVARHRPQRAERDGLSRPGQALEQHHHGALAAVQAGVRQEVGAVRSQARQQALWTRSA